MVVASSEIQSALSVHALRLVLSLATLLVPLRAAASESVRFEYDAPVGCPSEAAFIERVRERSLHGRFAGDGELARTFVVAITVDESGATARVDFVDADGSAVFRTVRGSTCEEAASGIALVTALAIDGRATTDAPATPAATVPAEPPPPAETSPAETPPAEPARASVHPTPSPATAASAPEQRQDSTLSFSAGVGAGYASHKGPSGAATLDVFFHARLSDDGPSGRVSAWHFRSEATSAGREARFRGFGSRLEACPFALGSRPWFIEPCLATEAGVVLAEGVSGADLADTRDSVRAWWDVLLIARAHTLISGWLLLEAQGELAVPLVAHRYGFGDPPVDPNVFAVPPVGVGARGGVGVRFP